MNKTRSWNGCGYNDYVAYLIRECHMDRYDAAREATDEFRNTFNARSYEGHRENRNGGIRK